MSRKTSSDWENTGDPEVLLTREMLYGSPVTVLKRKKLRENFLRKIHLFQGPQLAFWQLILEIKDEEIERSTERNPRTRLKIWPY